MEDRNGLPRWCSIDASELESARPAVGFPDFPGAWSGRRLCDKLFQLIAALSHGTVKGKAEREKKEVDRGVGSIDFSQATAIRSHSFRRLSRFTFATLNDKS